MSNTRKVILVIVVAFLVYAVFTQPGQSADSVDGAWGLLKDVGDSVSTFFDALLS